MLLRQLFELKHYNFVDEPMSWQEALRKCIDPLLADGSVEPEYADCLIENVASSCCRASRCRTRSRVPSEPTVRPSASCT